MPHLETTLPSAWTAVPDQVLAVDRALALRHAPVIHFDRLEPFLPEAVGYTVLRVDGPSPSFLRWIALPPGVSTVIEYAVWWVWDIQHLYELEHLWLYLDDSEQVVLVEGSWHGKLRRLEGSDGRPPLVNGRVTVYSEPGKHAFAPAAQPLVERAAATRRDCETLAGVRGLHVTRLFKGELRVWRNPYVNWLVVRYLRQQRFSPSFDFSKVVELRGLEPVTWPVLEGWIPQRVTWWTRHLYRLLLQENRAYLDESIAQVSTLESLPPGIVHMLEPIREGAVVVPPTRFGRMLWPLLMALLATLMVITRVVWLSGQQLLALLHRLGIREQTRFARYRSDVLAELNTAVLQPAPQPVVIAGDRLPPAVKS